MSVGYYLRRFYNVYVILIFIYILILLAWVLYLTKKLIVSNKLLRRNTCNESIMDNGYSVYNATTQVIKNKFLIALVVVETLTAVLPLVIMYIFAKKKLVWNTGSYYVNNSANISSETNETCMVDYRLIAVYMYPFFFLIPALLDIVFLLILSLLSMLTCILDMRYRYFGCKREVRKLAIIFSVQSLILIAVCFTQYTVLFEPLLFFVFLGYDFIVYVKLFKSLKLTLRGSLLELYTTKDCARSFEKEQRELKRYINFTIIFCLALLIPSIQFHIDLYFYLFAYSPYCIVKMFFLNSPNLVFISLDKISNRVVYTLLNLNPLFFMIPCFFMLLPHFSYVIYYIYCKVQKRRKQFRIYNTAITEKFI